MEIEDGIESVVVGFTDIYGRMMGKRFDAKFFIDDCAGNGISVGEHIFFA